MFSKIAFAVVLFVQLAFTAAQSPAEGIFAIQEVNGRPGNDYRLCFERGDVYDNLEIRSCPLGNEGMVSFLYIILAGIRLKHICSGLFKGTSSTMVQHRQSNSSIPMLARIMDALLTGTRRRSQMYFIRSYLCREAC